MKNNKAQASTEYLVILAVVIIVALVVVAVLGGFIDIGRGAGEQAGKTYWRSADIGLMDWVMDNSGADTLAVRNNLDYKINVTAISVGGTNVDVTDLELDSGETGTQTGAWSNCTTGSSYSLPVIFTYDNTEYNITGKTFAGIKNIEGTCVA
jgi:hypothetical protein